MFSFRRVSRPWLWAAVIFLLSFHAAASPRVAANESTMLQAESGWVRATAPGARAGAGFAVLRNGSDRVLRIVSMASPVADSVEIHRMSMDDGVMRMRRLDEVRIPAGETLELAPGGTHFMLMGLRHSLDAGQTVPLVLKLDGGHTLHLSLPVRDTAP